MTIRSVTSRRTGLIGRWNVPPPEALHQTTLAMQQEPEVLETLRYVTSERPVGRPAEVGDAQRDPSTGLEHVPALFEHIVE